MRPIFVLLIPAVASSVVAARSPQDKFPDVPSNRWAHEALSPRGELEKRAREFEIALKTKNIKWFEGVATPDFVVIDHGQKANLKQAMEGVKMMFQFAKTIDTASSKITFFSSSGLTAHVISDTKMTGKTVDPKGKTARFTEDTKTDEIWVLAGGLWKIKQETTVSDKMTVNGKPFNPQM